MWVWTNDFTTHVTLGVDAHVVRVVLSQKNWNVAVATHDCPWVLGIEGGVEGGAWHRLLSDSSPEWSCWKHFRVVGCTTTHTHTHTPQRTPRPTLHHITPHHTTPWNATQQLLERWQQVCGVEVGSSLCREAGKVELETDPSGQTGIWWNEEGVEVERRVVGRRARSDSVEGLMHIGLCFVRHAYKQLRTVDKASQVTWSQCS